MGKTMLAKATSRSIASEFSRVQLTPVLLPSDFTWTGTFDPRGSRFEWIAGSVLAPVVLADEINRATPRAHSALPVAMAEALFRNPAP